MISKLKNRDFSLVLSGGGALGIAHLGVLRDLEKYKLSPKEIIGTSMGGIIGACIAIGLNSKEIYKLLEKFGKVSNWIKFSLSGNSIIDSSKIENIFMDIFKERKIKDTKIPLKIIATNMQNGEKKVFNKNDDILIKDALLATMAIPGIFSEKVINNIVYADGFLCENLGVSEASLNTIVAVDVLGFNSYEPELPNNLFKTFNVLEMIEKSMRLLILNQRKLLLKSVKNKDIILLEPNTKEFKTFHFNKVEEIAKLGERLLDKI